MYIKDDLQHREGALALTYRQQYVSTVHGLIRRVLPAFAVPKAIPMDRLPPSTAAVSTKRIDRQTCELQSYPSFSRATVDPHPLATEQLIVPLDFPAFNRQASPP